MVNTVILVVNIIAILVSVGTLAAGATGVAALLAVSEIVIGAIDIYAIIERSNLEKTEEGKWFIKNWDRLSTAVGLLSIGGALRSGVLKHGPKLLSGIKNISTRGGKQLKEFIEKLLTTIQVEFYFAYKNQVLLGTLGFTIKDLSDFVGRRFAKKMARFGVSVFKPLDNESKIFGIVYNGEMIIDGTKAEISKALKKVFPHGVNDFNAISKNLDDLVEFAKKAKLRRAAFAKWASKFEEKFHIHFDGELRLERLSRRDPTPIQRGTGGHNHEMIGEKILIRRYLTEPFDNQPFDALISVKGDDGLFYLKTAKSSFFPKNWDIQRVKEEIALVYDEAIKLNKRFEYTKLDSTGTFKIRIQFDNVGNITNAHPKI